MLIAIYLTLTHYDRLMVSSLQRNEEHLLEMMSGFDSWITLLKWHQRFYQYYAHGFYLIYELADFHPSVS